MDDQILSIYCLCDGLLKALRQRDDPQCRMSDAEVMTTPLVAALFFGGNQEHARAPLATCLLTTGTGRPVEAFLAPGRINDTEAVKHYAYDLPPGSIIDADGGCTDYTTEYLLQDALDVQLRTHSARRTRRAPSLPPWCSFRSTGAGGPKPPAASSLGPWPPSITPSLPVASSGRSSSSSCALKAAPCVKVRQGIAWPQPVYAGSGYSGQHQGDADRAYAGMRGHARSGLRETSDMVVPCRWVAVDLVIRRR